MKFSTATDISRFNPEQQDALLAEIQREALHILQGEGMPDCWLDKADRAAPRSEKDAIIQQRKAAAAIDARPARDASFAAAATMFSAVAQARASLKDQIDCRPDSGPRPA